MDVWGPKGFHVQLNIIYEEDRLNLEDILNFLYKTIGNNVMSVIENPDGMSWIIKLKNKELAKIIMTHELIRTENRHICIKIIEHTGLNEPEKYYVRLNPEVPDYTSNNNYTSE